MCAHRYTGPVLTGCHFRVTPIGSCGSCGAGLVLEFDQGLLKKDSVYIVMAYIVMAQGGLGLYGYGLYSYGSRRTRFAHVWTHVYEHVYAHVDTHGWVFDQGLAREGLGYMRMLVSAHMYIHMPAHISVHMPVLNR